jgi:hypothetical protein
VKVVDFGVAKISTDRELSGSHSLKGKLAYMSPEQVSRAGVDRRSDIFALGIVLYEMTVGGRLFKGADEVETLRAVLDMKVRPPSELVAGYPPDLERIVLKALERSPERRYQTAREMQIDLEAFARDREDGDLVRRARRMDGGDVRSEARDLAHAADAARRQRRPERIATRRRDRRDAKDRPRHLAVASDALKPRARRRRMVLAAAVALLLVVAGGGAFAWHQRQGREAPSQAGRRSANDTVMLVAENGSVAIEARPSAPSIPAAPGSAAGTPPAVPRPRRLPRPPRAAPTRAARRAPPVPKRCRRRSPGAPRRSAVASPHRT